MMENTQKRMRIALVLLLALSSLGTGLSAAGADDPNDLMRHWGDGTAINNTVYYFSGTGYCQNQDSSGAKYNADCDVDWRGMAGYVIMICVLANTLIFVLGRVFHLQSLERLAKAEFFQVTASALMIFGATYLLTEGFKFIDQSGILPGATTTVCMGQPVKVGTVGPMQIMRCHIQEKITYTESIYNQAYAVVGAWEWFSTTSIYWWGIPVFVADWMIPGLHAKVEAGHYLANKMVPIAISLHAQFMLIEYIGRNMLPVFLPVGLLLRIVPFLRGIGSLMVAIALGFYIVFPIAYIILDPTTVRPPAEDLIDNPDPPDSPNQCFTTYSAMVNTVTKPRMSLTAGGTGSSNSNVAGSIDPEAIGKQVAQLQVEAFFLPLSALAATLLFIQALAGILGGDSGEIIHFVTKVI